MPPQDPLMQTAPDPRAELERLRKMKRLRELEAKAGGQPAANPALLSPLKPEARGQNAGQPTALAAPVQRGPVMSSVQRAQLEYDNSGAKSRGWRPEQFAAVQRAQGGSKDPGDVMALRSWNNSDSFANENPSINPESFWNAPKPEAPMNNPIKRAARYFTNTLADTLNIGVEGVNYAAPRQGTPVDEMGQPLDVPDVPQSAEDFQLPTIPALRVPAARNEGEALADMVGIGGGLAMPLGWTGQAVRTGGQALRTGSVLGKTITALTPQGTNALSKGTRLAGRVAAMTPEAAATGFGAGYILGGENLGGDGDRLKSGLAVGSDWVNYAGQPALLFLNRAAIFIKTAGRRVTPEVVEVQRAAEVLQRANATDAQKEAAAKVIDDLTPPAAQPAPFSAPAEPKASGFLRNNADRIVGGGVGAFAGSAGDAFAASGGDGNGGPDIVNPYTGAFAGMFFPRAAMRGYRGLRSGTNFDERVAARAVRNVLSPAGIKSAEQAAAEFTARFGDKPASVADLAQGGVGLAANLSRLPGATGEAALARGEQLLGGRAGRLERDIGQANPKLNPGAITGDVDRMIALAQEQATPAYDALRQQFPAGSVNSERLAKIEGIGSHIKAVDEYRAATAANEGRAVSDFEYWDLVKRDIDAKEQQLIAAGATLDDIRVRKLEGARAALVTELDDLMPGYAKARQLGGEAPKMREAFKQGQKLLDGNFLADEVSRMVSEVTGQQLTATQAGVIRNMMKKTQNGRTAMAALMSSDARKKLEAVFGKKAGDAMQARFAADAAIMTNMQRISPNVGSVTSQAELGGGGGVQQAAELAQQAVAFKTNPLAAGLAFLSRSGSYTKAQRDRMGEMLLGGNDPANLARIYGNRPPRNPLNVAPPPAPSGPPMNALAPAARIEPPPLVMPEAQQIGRWEGPAPQKPQSLLAWVRGQGGIKDRNYMSGDLKAVMGKSNAMPGLLNNQSGKGLDDIVAAAYEQGFDVDPNDANSLMRLIEEEMAGNPSYRIGAREEWDIYQEYLAAKRGDL